MKLLRITQVLLLACALAFTAFGQNKPPEKPAPKNPPTIPAPPPKDPPKPKPGKPNGAEGQFFTSPAQPAGR